MAGVHLGSPLRSVVLLVLLLCVAVASAYASSIQNDTFSGASFRNTTSVSGQSTSKSASEAHSGTPSAASSDVSSTGTYGLGDFVAAGIGMSASSESSSSIVGEQSTHQPSVTGTSLSRTLQKVSSSLSNEEDDESITSTTHASEGLAFVSTNLTLGMNLGTAVIPKPTNATATETGYIPDNPNAIPPDPPILYNQSFTLSGDCWNQWSQFWSASSLVTQYESTSMSSPRPSQQRNRACGCLPPPSYRSTQPPFAAGNFLSLHTARSHQ